MRSLFNPPYALANQEEQNSTFTEKVTRLLRALLFVMLLSACSQNGSATADGLITGPGSFSSPSGAYQLVIRSKPKSLIDYKIINVATKKEFAPKYLFSDVMRWAAYWENDDTLWVYSSDIGTSVWKRNSRGDFSQSWLGEKSDLAPTIPAKIWQFLPSSSQRQWKSSRIPKRFNATIGGFMGASYKVALHDGVITYTSFGGGHTNPKHTTITPTAAQWNEFRETLDDLNVWQWRSDYPSNGTADGTQWSLDIAFVNRAIKTDGNNNYPNATGKPNDKPAPTRTFHRYLDAIKKLTSGKTFQ